jgi:two-component system, chemotaxis family, protein-glutamate methylesterase/glutaminase
VTLLQHLPADLGVAVVIVNHVRRIATTLHKILPRFTSMPVELITERLLIEPNRVYFIRKTAIFTFSRVHFNLYPFPHPGVGQT